MYSYTPRTVPTELEELVRFLRDELETISRAMTTPVRMIQLEISFRPPEKLREGMIVLADGTHWNPGSGAGFYGYRNGAWQHLG